MPDKKPESVDVKTTTETKEAEETRKAIAEKPETGPNPDSKETTTETTTTTTQTGKEG